MLQDDGWRRDRTTGSHMMYVHPTKPGPVVVVPAGGKGRQDVPPATLTAQLRDAVELYLSYYRDRGQPAPPAHARVGSLSAA
jgi:predicted RNA binding protein YcfA (HicA-like mRNA interferase family)